jgi:thymidine phosphorylase
LKLGDEVRAGEAIGVVYCADSAAAAEAARRIQAAYEVGDVATQFPRLVKEIVNE